MRRLWVSIGIYGAVLGQLLVGLFFKRHDRVIVGEVGRTGYNPLLPLNTSCS